MALALQARTAEAERPERASRLFDPAGEDTLDAVCPGGLGQPRGARGGSLSRLRRHAGAPARGSEAAECGDCGSSLE